MRNLRNIRYDKTAVGEITSVCWDAAQDQTLVTIGPSEDTGGKIELVRVTDGPALEPWALQVQTVASWDAPSPSPDIDFDKVVDAHHFSDNLTTCIVLAGGDIVIVQEDESTASAAEGVHIEIVGSIDAGITAARWSPDEELLVITTTAGTVVYMSRSFDGIAEATMAAEDLRMSKHVSVGWGKKETQFQGRGAKALRDPTIPEKVDEGVLSPHDDRRTTISWRGDGAFVAVNSLEASDRRVIRVYSREGVLDSVSEPVDGLEGSLSWRPAGNLMAGIQRLADRVDVVFFERNGLRHGQYTLRAPHELDSPDAPIGLQWNSDSTVLAVTYGSVVQLWTTGNYHWYLKQEIYIRPGGASVVWHPEKPLRLATAAHDELLLTEHIFSVARGPLVAPNDHGAVAVIDGSTVKLTPMRTANVPPPMALYEISAASSVVDVAFSKDHSAMAVLHQTGVDFYSWQTKGPRSLAPKLLGKSQFGSGQGWLYNTPACQVCFEDSENAQVIYNEDGPQLSVCRPGEVTELGSLASRAPGQNEVASFVSSSDIQAAIGQTRRGALYRMTGDTQESVPARFPLQLPWAEVVEHEENLVAFGLSRSGHLYANSRLLTKNCTSFVVTTEHLVLTTSNHYLKFVHLDGVEDLDVPADDPENDERCRSIERGARLVTVMPSNMSVVLQMPRGNLETIYPRALVVAGIRKLIEGNNYEKAFTTCRAQRVDMNILYDHRPEHFLSNVKLFLDQLKDVTYIDLFLSGLKEEDVTQTMYKDTKPVKNHEVTGLFNQISPTPAAKPAGSKVNAVCDAVLASLRTQKNANLQNIITAHVCKNPPALDDGLLVVAELMQEDEKLAERAVEHICFLADVNQLYDQALGLYKLDLTLLVAQQSQRDPREYLPFIQGLHQMTDLRRKFTIDDYLNHRQKALSHLHALNAFDEVQDYTTKYSLYQTALGLYRYEPERHHILTNMYAEFLESNSKHREAGLAYESLQNFVKATKCYRAVGATSWRECLFAAQQQQPPLSATAVSELASNLADALFEAKDYTSAATVHLDYLSSVESAIRCLCKGYHFAEALRLVALRDRPDLLETAVDAGLAEALSSSTELLADCKAQLKAQIPRILELRRKAAEDPLGFYEGERAAGLADIPDDVSVASSRVSTSASLFTRYTGKAGSVGTVGTGVSRATHKNRKREEKKRARGRKGTVYEEEYLVNSVRRLIERVGSTGPEVERLVFGLARRGMGERARAVEGLMGEVVEGCRTAVGEIWGGTDGGGDAGEGDTKGPGGGGPEEEYRRVVGGDAVLAETLEAMKARQTPPLVNDFARLSLLG